MTDRYKERWKVKTVSVQPGVKADKGKVEEWTLQGWEPYAVTWDGHQWDHHLRKFFYNESDEEIGPLSHLKHYQVCNCLAGSGTCCQVNCDCQEELE